MFGIEGFYVAASGAIQSHHGPLVFLFFFIVKWGVGAEILVRHLIVQSGGACEEYNRYFDEGQIQVLTKGRYTFFLGRDRLRLKDENVFIHFKCSFLFDFLPEVLTHDCVFREKEKTDESQKFNLKRVPY